MALSSTAQRLLATARERKGAAVWLTGAGISAESGIPTFRGEQGFWTVGSRNYHPQEMATMEAFREMPDEVWAWYLYRRSVCRAAAPNAAHEALVALERASGDDFLLVTQNVDGLHTRAGNSLARTYQIHGNVDYMRPVGGSAIVPIPSELGDTWDRHRKLTAVERTLLQHEGVPTRPHVLWFDEIYSEELYRYESSLEAVFEASVLVIVGTTGGTNLPFHMGRLAQKRLVPMIIINPERNPFVDMVEDGGVGCWLSGTAGEWVPQVAAALGA